MTQFKRAMSLLLSLCLVMAMLSPAALAAELSENTDSDNTVSAVPEAPPAAPEDSSEGEIRWGEADVSGQLFQEGSFTGPQSSPDEVTLFSGSNSETLIYRTILGGLLNKSSTIDISNCWFPYSDEGVSALNDWYTLVINDHPELFYATGAYAYWYNGNGQIYQIDPKYDTRLPSNYQQLFDAAAEKALAQVQPDMSVVEIMLVLHDYLAVNCVYNWNVATEKDKSTYPANIYDAYGVLVRGDAVCQGYAEAYQYLLTRLGIPCVLASSDAMDHSWNQVKLGGQWYHVDVTWDDPVPNTYGKCYHNYFLLSDWAISDADHRHHDWRAPNYCTDTTFDTGYVYPDVFYPFHWKDGEIYYLEYDRNAYRERLWKGSGNSREEFSLGGKLNTNAGVCWLGDCLYYIGQDDNLYDWSIWRGIYYCDIASGRQGCLGYFKFNQSGSSDGAYSADADSLGMRYLPSINKFIIESSTRPGQTPFCNFDPAYLPDYPASWDSVTGTQFIEMLSDGRVGVRTEVSSSVLWIAYYNSSGKMTDLERYNLAGSGIHLVRPKDPDASVSRAKLMLTSSQGNPLCPAYPLSVINPSQRNQGVFSMYFSQNSA